MLAGIGLLLAGIWIGWSWPRSSDSLLKLARQQLAQSQFEDAESLALQVLSRSPDNCPARLIAARAAVGLRREAAALQYLRGIPPQRDSSCAPGFKLAAEIAHRLGRAAEEEQFLKRLLEVDATDTDAANQLAYLLGVEGRAFEALEPLFSTLKQGKFTAHHLVMLAAGEPVVSDPDFVARCLQAVPDDPLPRLGSARGELATQIKAQVEPLLRQIIAARPDCQEAQARWGQLLQQGSSESALLEWHSRLPTDAWHPEIWVVRGHWARRHQEPRVAARCFWEALRRDPNHRVACYQLGQLSQEMGRTEAANACLKRAALLEKLVFLVDRIYENPQSPQLMWEAAQLTESLGRLWEAWGWARGASLVDPNHGAARVMVRRLQPVLNTELPRTLPKHQLGEVLDFSHDPLPAWKPGSGQSIRGVSPAGPSLIRFEDVAIATGLKYTYDNGHERGSETTRMLESMGGGVAVLDFDRDGWSDIYFTQGGRWPSQSPAHQPSDKLFRNLFGRAFADVTASSGLGDRDFSQGCTVGDFDGDGFPDLYVANIGRNRLYRNLGDGTFVDVTELAGIKSEAWTTSCLMADLNGDSWPDLYDVNYLSIADAPPAICVKGKESGTCGPGVFPAEADQIYVNLGDGRFEDATKSSGIDIPNGKGLGIVAADFTQSGRIDLFVANDSVPNFYFVNQTSKPGESPRFSEQALVTGLALSHDGLSAAWMGVAAGDANGDGRLDLFATTYADQAKSLFLQEPTGGYFQDAIIQSGLRAPTWRVLGFGTQFLDADLDGWSDLVLTNGHVFDLSYKNEPYQMPPQFFRNLGSGRFREVPAMQLGPFFSGKYLGRGLARLDWDRDGRDDFVVSHMNAPAALVANRTSPVGHSISVRLVGTQTNRDVIGTRVTVRSGTRKWTRQLTAGDGFQASNECKLIFGLGDRNRVDELIVHWLSGTRSVFKNLSVDSEWLLIEGQEPVSLPNLK